MNRRKFFTNLAGIFVAASAPTIFVPKLIKTGWKPVAFPVSPELMRNAGAMQEAFAAYIGPVIKNVLSLYNANTIYSDYDYREENCPSIPLDLYYGPMPRKRGQLEGCRIL
jgi:hypothetical protein